MSLRNRFGLCLAAFIPLILLAGCGSSSNSATAPPSGGFSNTNLNGTYVFSTTGSDPSGVLIATAGTFTACGCSAGTISGGVIDVNDPAVGLLSGQAITSGHYSVGVDGRPGNSSGLLTLQTSAGNFTYDFVLSSSSHGQIILFDTSNGGGSGTLDLQSTVAQTDIDSKSFAFNLSGVGSLNTSTGAQTPFATVGAFSLDASGNIGATTTGVEDFNSNGLAICGSSGCTMTGGSVSLATVPGTASFTTSAGTFNFDVYPVDPTHLKFIEVDSLPVIAGDAFTQSAAIPTGNNVFTVSGYDAVLTGPFTAAGLFDTDGNGNIKTDSVEDINDALTPIQITGPAITGTYSSVTGGRSLITLTGFVNGDGGLGCSACQFAAYPSTGGTQLLEIDNAGVTDGVAYAQGSSPTLSASDGFGMNLSGYNGVEEDDIAEFTNTSGAFSGLIDFNDSGSLTFDQKFSSTYAADSTVSGRGVVTPGTNAFNLVTYVIDSSTVVFVETDTNQVGLGAFVTQNASAQSNAAARHLAVLGLKLKPGAKKPFKRN